MFSIKNPGVIALLLLVTVTTRVHGAPVQDAEESLRTWTASSGNTIEARYVDTEYGWIQLKTSEGKVLKINERSLSSEDRAWIKKREAMRNAPAGVKQPKSPSRLPVFDGGKHNGLHAIYSAKNFDACVDDRGNIVVYPKERGERLKKHLRCRLACYYHTDKRMRGRTIVAFDPLPMPVEQPNEITLSGTLLSNVFFTVTHEFSETGIKSYGYCIDPKDIDYPTRYRMIWGIPASHHFADQFPLSEREKILEGWHVLIEPIKGKKRTFTYYESVRSMGGRDKALMISEFAFGEREISFKAGRPDDAPLIPYIYSGNSPWQGYLVQFIKNENDSKSKSEDISLIIK